MLKVDDVKLDVPPMPGKPKKKVGWKVPVILASTLAIGIGAGAAIHPTPDPVVVTKTNTVTVTETQDVPFTPQACIKALDLASKGYGITAGWPPLVAKAYEAGVNMDLAQAQEVLSEGKDLNRQLAALTPQVASASATCRASA